MSLLFYKIINFLNSLCINIFLTIFLYFILIPSLKLLISKIFKGKAFLLVSLFLKETN